MEEDLELYMDPCLGNLRPLSICCVGLSYLLHVRIQPKQTTMDLVLCIKPVSDSVGMKQHKMD